MGSTKKEAKTPRKARAAIKAEPEEQEGGRRTVSPDYAASMASDPDDSDYNGAEGSNKKSPVVSRSMAAARLKKTRAKLEGEVHPNGRVLGRKLVHWHRERMVEKLLLIIQYECHHEGLKIPWDKVVQRLEPGCSGGAALQYLNKMRDILIAEGHMIPPPLGRRATGGDTSVRGLVRDFESENPTTSKPLPWTETYEHPKKSLTIPGIVRGSGNYVRDGGELATSHQKSISTPRHRRDRALNSHLQMKSPVVERVKRVIAKRRASRAIVKYDRGPESDFEATIEGSNGNGKKTQSRGFSSEADSGGESEKDNLSQGHTKMGDISLLDGSSIIGDAASSVAKDQAGVDLFQKLDGVPEGYENIEDNDVEEGDAATSEDEGGASAGDDQLQLAHNSQGQRNRALLDLSLDSSPRTPNAGAADVNRLSTLVQREANNQSIMQLFDFSGMGGDPGLYNNMITSPYWFSPGMHGLPIHHPYGNSDNYGGYSDYGIGFAGTHNTNGGNFFENRRNNIFTSNLLGVADEFPSNRTQFPAPSISSIGHSNQNIAGGVQYSNVGDFADMGSQHLNE